MTGRKTLSALALLGLVMLAGCAAGTPSPQTSLTQTSSSPTAAPTPTAPPAPQGPTQELTYIGKDGNVYEMGWPNGTPQQWTNKAQLNKVSYGGLVWSPDGSTLAVLRLTGPQYTPTGYALIEFSSTGQVLHSFTLSNAPYNTPFAWSPDGSEIAYRSETTQYIASNGDIEGRLTILNAQTGATKQTFLYDDGGGGCGGGGFPALVQALGIVHHSYMNPDTFAWTPGQQSILVSRGCGNNEAELVNLGTHQVATQYPGSASYQPGGTFIVGEWYGPNTITLGLANLNAAEHSTLASAPLQSNGPTYTTTIGVATWSPDGQSVYYEHNNGIWTVGADGSNAHQVVAGAPNDSQGIATVQALPSVSPDGSLLLYLQLHGSGSAPGGSVTYQCYVAHTDGSNAAALPQGASSAAWRPVKK